MTLPPSSFETRPALRSFAGRTVVVGVRPEDLGDASLAHEVRPGSVITTDVELTESLGSEVIVHFLLDARRVDAGNPDVDTDLVEVQAVARFDPRTSARAGERTDIVVGVENLHFFDPETGLAIRD